MQGIVQVIPISKAFRHENMSAFYINSGLSYRQFSELFKIHNMDYKIENEIPSFRCQNNVTC